MDYCPTCIFTTNEQSSEYNTYIATRNGARWRVSREEFTAWVNSGDYRYDPENAVYWRQGEENES